jgi:putative flippase GtrA
MFLFWLPMSSPSDSSLSALARKLSQVSVLRFGVVGVSNTLLSFTIFWSAHRVLPAAAAQGLSYAVGMIWSYYWNRRWTFQSRGNLASEAGRFFSLQIGFMLLSAALLGLLVDHAHLPSGPSWLAVTALITVLNFVASRYWAFKPAV